MNKTLVAIYDDIVIARQVVEDLVNADFERSSISLITNDAHNQYSHYLDENYTPREDAVTAGEGAGFGAVVGTLTGLLVGAAALVVPGIGLAIVAGPIVAGLTGALAGAITGGIVGALVKSGVPEDDAPYYAEGIRRGGTLISIETSNTLQAEDIMHRNGSINIHERSSLWQQDGWKGFNADVESIKNDVSAKATPITLVTPTTYNNIPKEIHATDNPNPIGVIHTEPMVAIESPIDDEDDDEDAAKTLPITPIPTVTSDEPVVVVHEEDDSSGYEDINL